MSGPTPTSGDPFAQAYARGRPSPSRYDGYVPGVDLSCPPQANEALEECVKAARHLLSDTIVRAEPVPWLEPPYHARFEKKHEEAVLSTTLAFNPVTNASGLLLRAANTSPGFTPALLEMSSAVDAQAVFTLEIQQGYMARVKSWGISAGAAGPAAISVRAKAAAVGGRPVPPDPFLSSYPVDQQQDAFVILLAGQSLTIEALLRDTGSPALIDFGICYWIWPVNTRKDTREGAILRSGYGRDC